MTVSSQLLGQYPAPLYGVQATKPAVPFCGCVGVLGASRSLTLTQPTLTWLSQHGSLDGLQVQAIRDARHGHGEELPGVRLALDRDGEVPAGTCCSSGAEGGGAREAARGWEVPVRASPQPPAQVLGRLVACPTALRSSTDVASQYAAGSAPNRRRSRVGHVPSPHALSLHAPEQRRWMAHPVRKGGPCRVVAGVQPHAAKRYPRLPVHRSSEGAQRWSNHLRNDEEPARTRLSNRDSELSNTDRAPDASPPRSGLRSCSRVRNRHPSLERGRVSTHHTTQ